MGGGQSSEGTAEEKYPQQPGSKTTPLMAAIAVNDIDSVKYFLERGDSVTPKDDFGRTALHYVAEFTNNALLFSLIVNAPRGIARLNAPDNDGKTPLITAAYNGHYNVLYQLLSYDKINVKATDYWGRSALVAAQNNKNWECEAWLSIHMGIKQPYRRGAGRNYPKIKGVDY
jgi:ankyrin repeat protein